MHRAASEGERGEGLHWVASVADGNNTHRGESFEKTEAEALVNDGGGGVGTKRPGEKILLTLCYP